MRLISQDGRLDVPYEKIAVNLKETDRTQIIGYGIESFDNNSYFVLGKYSTEEKARKVMELLQMAYTGRFITTASVPDNFDETMKELMKHGFGTVVVKDEFDSKVEFENLNGYFIFPKDDEVEV